MQEAIDYLSKKDKTINFIVSNFGNPIVLNRPEGFSSMCHIILEQQVSIASAKASYDKLQNYFGELTAFKILNCADHELKSCGISRQKIIYLKDLALKIFSKEIEFESFKSKSEQEIRNELITIKGVGTWSIEVYLMFCLQRPDIIPLGDIAVKNTLKELYYCENYNNMVSLSENWKPYRTLATCIIWHYYLKKRNKI
ncbi:MAG: DNA-3-methyladenine glycosylase 2 family protein [Flavobacterium sp.]|nr:DNA-3-methyladenine glycosylase 2 family protein [Flavobacterium sp.]